MRKLTLVTMILVGTLSFAVNYAFAQSTSKAGADPWAGTWKLDAAKSKIQGPAPREETLKSEATGANHNEIKYALTGTAADGSPINESYNGKADGQPYPFIANGQEVAKISYHRDSDHQYTTHGTSADGTASTGTVTLSKDNKTLTVQEHVKSPQGEFDQTIVYNKQ